MNKLTYKLVALLIAITAIGQMDALQKRVNKRTAQSPAKKVSAEVSVLEQIVEQARIIVETTGAKAHKNRTMAKVELTKLMRDLDPSIKNVISDDIDTIKAFGKTVESRNEAKEAYTRFLASVNSINAQANVVMAAEEGRNAIDRAPADMKQSVAAQEEQNIKMAEDEAAKASFMSRTIAGVQSTLAMPGDYIFGKEESTAKSAFNSALVAAGAAAAAYGAYKFTPEGTGTKALATAKYWTGRPLSIEEKEAIGVDVTAQDWQTRDQFLRTRRAEDDIAQRAAVRNAISLQQADDRARVSSWGESGKNAVRNYISPVPKEESTWDYVKRVTSNTANSVTTSIANAANYAVGRPTSAQRNAQIAADQEYERYHQQ